MAENSLKLTPTLSQAMLLKLTPTVSQVIAQLTALLQEHGDIPVWMHDVDTGWPMGIESIKYSHGDYVTDAFEAVHIFGCYK